MKSTNVLPNNWNKRSLGTKITKKILNWIKTNWSYKDTQNLIKNYKMTNEIKVMKCKLNIVHK